MSDTIDRMALAIWKANGEPDVFDTYAEELCVAARAALEALREPTEAMIERGSQIAVAADFDITGAYRVVGTVSRDVWRAMVDEALR